MNETIRLLSKILEFTSELSKNEIKNIISGKAKLAVISDTNNLKPEKDYSEDVKKYCELLEKFSTREEAQDLLSKVGNKSLLIEIAKNYHITTYKKNTEELITMLVEKVVGSKIRFDSLRDTNLK